MSSTSTVVLEASRLPVSQTSDGTVELSQEKKNELKELAMVDDVGAADVYTCSETETCWYHWTGSIWVKPHRFENRTGEYVIALKTEPHAELGKHRHRGQVKAYTVKGPWGYHE